MTTPRLGALGRLTGLALVGDEQDGGQVGEDARAAEEGERNGADPHEDGIDVEVLRDAAADAADDAIAACTVEPARARRGRLRRRLLGGRLALGRRLLGGRLALGRRLLGGRVVLVRWDLVRPS